ncbi:MAG: anti-sigma factor antagonist [Planctomycetota bacterium]|nr:MAG: anti-sigma factor antagonist [Planctomycetota bacterium]
MGPLDSCSWVASPLRFGSNGADARHGPCPSACTGTINGRNSEQAVFQIREWQMSQDKQIFGFEQCGEVLIVTATGSFMEFRDNDIRNGYNEAFRQLSEPGIRHLLVDFSAMQYFGSTFVGILIRLAKKARANNGNAALCHMSDNMKDMLKTLMLLENPKIDFSWVAYPDRAAALQALSLL